MASDQQPLPFMNGDEDPYKSEGRIELRIEDFSKFAEEKSLSQRLSAPVYVRGVAWKICAEIYEYFDQSTAQSGQKKACLNYFLQCNDLSTDLSWSYTAIAQYKILAQNGDKTVDHVCESRHTNFNANERSFGFYGYMKVEDLMDPAKSFYDEQTDSIVLAVDLRADFADGNCKFVLVAENELKLDKVPISFSMRIGQLEWQITFDFHNQSHFDNNNYRNKDNGEKYLVITCNDIDMAKKTSKGMDNNKVLLELFGYYRKNDSISDELYSPISENESVAIRHLFTREDRWLPVDIPAGYEYNNLLFTVRVQKERNLFPDFTKSNVIVRHNTANVKLRVGDQQFHVNKQLLSSFSLFFDRMFHGDYTAATQEEVELSLNTHSAELFHQFLLVLFVNEVLPNSMNVAALFKLADFYDAENVRAKCDHHLRIAREMPIEERVILARDHGSEETQDLIVGNANFEQLKTISLLLIRNR